MWKKKEKHKLMLLSDRAYIFSQHFYLNMHWTMQSSR